MEWNTPVSITEIENVENISKCNIYVFDIAYTLTKPEIKIAIEKLFKVEIEKLNIAKIPIKFKKIDQYIGKLPQKKRLYLKLKPGYRLVSKVFN